jgi:DNA-binding transcriptional ArsR family regulator
VVSRLVNKESVDQLTGPSFDIYCLILKSSRPLGIRETQRALNLSSPSVAQYHLSKLENAGLIEKRGGSYGAKKVLLKNRIRLRRYLIPKPLFYTILGLAILVFHLHLLKLTALTTEDILGLITILIFILLFSYQTLNIFYDKIL